MTKITKEKLFESLRNIVANSNNIIIANQKAIITSELERVYSFYESPKTFIEKNRSIKEDWLYGHIFIRLGDERLKKETRDWLHKLGFMDESIVDLQDSIILRVVDKNEYKKLFENI